MYIWFFFIYLTNYIAFYNLALTYIWIWITSVPPDMDRPQYLPYKFDIVRMSESIQFWWSLIMVVHVVTPPPPNIDTYIIVINMHHLYRNLFHIEIHWFLYFILISKRKPVEWERKKERTNVLEKKKERKKEEERRGELTWDFQLYSRRRGIRQNENIQVQLVIHVEYTYSSPHGLDV